jgi:phage terminase small subunit
MSSSLINPNRKRGISKSRLNDKQLMFIHAYLADNKMNAKAAAVKAGYSRNMSNKLLAHPLIKAEIGNQIRKRLEGFDVTAQRVIEELAALGFSNPKHLINPETGAVYEDISEMPDHVAASIRNISITQQSDGSTTMSVDFYDKLSALSLLYRHVGLDKDANPDAIDQEASQAAGKLLNVIAAKIQEEESSNVVDAEAIEKLA